MQTPLSFANSNIYLNVLVGDIVDAKGRTVIKGVDARTAIKIIQAVNAHDAMREALEYIKNTLEYELDDDALAIISKALALAEGKP